MAEVAEIGRVCCVKSLKDHVLEVWGGLVKK